MCVKSFKLLVVAMFISITDLLYAGTPPNDASISSIEPPYGNHCSGPLPIKVVLNNYGSQELDSVNIWLSINDTIRNSYKWTGHLKQDSSTLVAIGGFLFSKGTYTITAWTSKPNGQVDSVPDNDSATLLTSIGPDAGGKDSICFGSSVKLGSNLLSGDSYTWTSNPPGFTSTVRRPTVSPKQTTTYYLTETNSATNCIQRDTAIIYLNPSHPISAFTVNQGAQCLKGNSFIFTDRSVILGTVKSDTLKTASITSWTWDFGDKTTSKLQNPIHSYLKAGTYIVKLKVTGEYSCKDSIVRAMVVNPTPYPVIIGPNSICLGLNDFYQTKPDSGSTYDWFITGGSIASGNGTSKLTVHWIDSMNVSVNVREITAQGCVNDAKQMNVSVMLPRMAPSPNACIGQPFTFFGQSVAAVASLWKFGDGDTSDMVNPRHTYKTLGKYTVNLKVTSSTGCQDSVAQSIKVNPLPNAHWKVGSLLTANIDFKADDSDLAVSDYEWDFGDGTSEQITAGFNPTHVFLQNKPYLVKLSLTDDNGCVNSFDSTVNVKKSDMSLSLEENLNLMIYPNPFKDGAVIVYYLPKTATITISICDISGKQIDIISQETERPGEYRVNINKEKNKLTPSIYLLKFVMDGQYVSRSIVKY